MPYLSKRKLHSKAASDAAQHQKTRVYAAGSCDAEPPAPTKSVISEIPDSQEMNSSLDESDSVYLPECGGGILPGAWPEWSDAEDEEQESETEE